MKINLGNSFRLLQFSFLIFVNKQTLFFYFLLLNFLLPLINEITENVIYAIVEIEIMFRIASL